MTWKTLMRGEHLEPPPWLYARMAQGSLLRLIYRLFVDDLAKSLPPGARLLDVGTGPGYLPGYLALVRPDLEICGVDFCLRHDPAGPAPASGPGPSDARGLGRGGCLFLTASGRGL